MSGFMVERACLCCDWELCGPCFPAVPAALSRVSRCGYGVCSTASSPVCSVNTIPGGFIPSTKPLNQDVQSLCSSFLSHSWQQSVVSVMRYRCGWWFGDLYYPVLFKTPHTWTVLPGPQLEKKKFGCTRSRAPSALLPHPQDDTHCRWYNVFFQTSGADLLVTRELSTTQLNFFHYLIDI